MHTVEVTEVKLLAQGHIAGRKHSQNSNQNLGACPLHTWERPLTELQLEFLEARNPGVSSQ